ncbi:MAG: tetratricopeptide repeat protein, partial [Terriglobales bacterium]
VRLLDIVEKTMNGDHRYNFTTMHKLAFVYRTLKKYPEAEKLLLKALKTIDTPLGPCEEFKLDLALVCVDQDKNAEADTNFQQAINGFLQRKNYPRLAEALEAYAQFLNSQGRKEEAQQTEARAQHIRATNHTHEHPNDIFPSTLLRA